MSVDGSRKAEAVSAFIDDVRANVPAAMRERRQWLVWRFFRKPNQAKPAKMPYYLNGNPRGWPHGMPPHKPGEKAMPTAAQPKVKQGHELDRQHLCTMDEALQAMRSGRWEGIGFAFLPGDGLIGIDVDRAIDGETGEVAEQCQEIIRRCGSYTELSPSGTGVHIIVEGQTETFKDNGVGVEVFCGSQFFTVTGRPTGGQLVVKPLGDQTLAWLRKLVKGDKPDQVVRQRAKPLTQAPAGAPDDFQRVNAMAMALLDVWVPVLFPSAMRSSMGYRVRQADLPGRADLVEDLSITSSGIVDYGVHDMGDPKQGRRSPIDLVVEWKGLGLREALKWLASLLGVQVSGPPAARQHANVVQMPAVRPPAPPAEGERVPPDSVEESPGRLRDLSEMEPAGAASPAGEEATAKVLPIANAKARKRKKKGDNENDARNEAEAEAASREFWQRVHTFAERFMLIESTDEAWDRRDFTFWKVANMRIRFGRELVNSWLHLVSEERSTTVRPSQLVFEPGRRVQEPEVNMFGGFTVQPLACAAQEVKPMLDLLRHLCSETSFSDEASADDVDAAMHWVLCWQALPLQRPGTKMQTACVFHGAQGTGKNLYWDMWRNLFGDYGITVGQTELEDKFNGWVSRKLAIVGDEVVSRQEMYHNKNRLKLIVTQEEKFAIRGMQKETRWETNCANVCFLSNESQPLALEERDRRWFVVYTPLEADVELYQAVRDFKASDGLRKWFYYLQTYPVGDFNAHTKPIMTKAKESLIELNWKPSERFAHEWLNGFLDLRVNVCSAEQLYRAFRRWSDRQGERWPPSQALFTTQVQRWARERVKRDSSGRFEDPKLRYKQIALKSADPDGARKTVRCWIPNGCGPRGGASEGEWAGDAVRSFEQEVARYCRTPGVSEESQ